MNRKNNKSDFRLLDRKGRGTKRSVNVEVRNGNIEGALREMKKRLKKDDFFLELRRREYYMKPSEVKKMKRRRRKTSDGDNL